MRNVISLTLLSLSIVFSSVASSTAMQTQNITPAQKAAITTAVDKLSKQAGKKFPITDISPSPVQGIYQVTSDMTVFYITPNGEYIFFGDLLDVNQSKHSLSLTENATRALRSKALAALNDQDMIIFPSTAAKKIGTITVFTDIDCPYCRKLQEDIKQYTDAGIDVRYVSFPRTGPKTPSFDEAIKVWCAADKRKAYINAIELKEFPKESCKKNPVMMEYELGQKFAITGTPTIILDNGTKIGGLVDAKTLVKIFADSNKS